jgi:hypothetical protein
MSFPEKENPTHGVRMCFFRWIKWDEVGWASVIHFFLLLGRASSGSVTAYSFQIPDDPVPNILTDDLVLSKISPTISLLAISHRDAWETSGSTRVAGKSGGARRRPGVTAAAHGRAQQARGDSI